jgi:hypothetical protein
MRLAVALPSGLALRPRWVMTARVTQGHLGLWVHRADAVDPDKGGEMTRSRRDSRIPPRALTLAGSSRSAPRSPNLSADHQTAIWVIGLAVLGHMLRSRRLYERAAVAAIVVAALSGQGQQSWGKTLARLTAWVKRQDERLERKVKGARPTPSGR